MSEPVKGKYLGSELIAGGSPIGSRDYPNNHGSRKPATSMTLREWYSGAAMQGLLSDAMSIASIHKEHGDDSLQQIAQASVGFADALIKELEK